MKLLPSPHNCLRALSFTASPLLLAAFLATAFNAQATVYTNSQMIGFSSGNLGSVGAAEGWQNSAAYANVTAGSGSLDGTPLGLAASAGDKGNVTASGSS